MERLKSVLITVFEIAVIVAVVGSIIAAIMHTKYSDASDAEEPKFDQRRVIVAVYYMPGSSPGSPSTSTSFSRRRIRECPACDLLKADEHRLMQERPDVFWGISSNNWSPSSIITFNGDHRYYRSSKGAVSQYPTVIIYAGTPGSWGSERYRLVGYTPRDYDKLVTMIDWASEY